MGLGSPDYVEIEEDDVRPIVGQMAEMAAAHSGWINFEPAVPVEDVPPPKAGLFSLFSGRGPDAPLVTWTPGEVRKGRTEPVTVGILHPSGSNARARLIERGHPVPEGWVVTQDYSKKGLVLAVPATVRHADVVEWLLGAARVLTSVPLTGTWRAVIYRP
jgi:hypothetical protein